MGTKLLCMQKVVLCGVLSGIRSSLDSEKAYNIIRNEGSVSYSIMFYFWCVAPFFFFAVYAYKEVFYYKLDKNNVMM